MESVRRSRRKSAFGLEQKRKQTLGFMPPALGQSYPGSCPQDCPPPEPMGLPLSIGEAARLIGCSPWTVRQTLMPRGPSALPVRRRQIDLLQRPSHSLDRKPAERSHVSLFKRGNVWWSYFYLDGIRHQYSTGTSNRKQAEKIEAKLKEEVNNQRFQIVEADPDMTLRRPRRPVHRQRHRPAAPPVPPQFLLPFFAEIPVLRITKSLAEEFRTQAAGMEAAASDQGRHRQPRPERPPPHSLLGRR